ncbi:MAG TPA: PPC domain-containing protein [Candidatus Acidoferrum sp.]|nr:PPC domain-containing protein [Candidatus Acidoferrum sp.]
MRTLRAIAVGAALWLGIAVSAQSQSNDFCSNAIPLTLDVPATVNTLSATSTGDPAPNCVASLGRGVWYLFMPITNEWVTISTCGSDFDTGLAVYTGNCVSRSQVVCDDDDGPACPGLNASVMFSGVAGTTYYILAGGYGGAGGNLQITATASPPPPNDSCAGAVPMTEGTVYTMNTLNATATGDPSPCCFGLDRSVWYTFTPPITERVTITTCGSDFNTAMAVYSGSCASPGSPIVSNDDNGPACSGNNSSVNFSATGGVTYYILVGGSSGAGGNLQIEAIASPPPANDTCAGAVPMTEGVVYTVNTVQATEVGDPSPCCFGLGRGVWYTFTPPITERVTVTTCGSDFNTAMAVYTGSCASLSSPIVSNDDNGPACSGNNASVNFSATAGVTYYILVGGSSGAGGDLQIQAVASPPPANDTCAGAVPMTEGVTYTVNTVQATEVGDPSPCCFGLGRGVWYAFTPPITERVTISTCGSDFNTAMAVYTGSCASLGSPLVSDDDNGPDCGGNNASVNFSATAGVTYYVLVGGSSGAGGNLQIKATASSPPANDTCAGAVPMTEGVVYTVNTVQATEVGDPSPCCFGLGRGVWYSFTPPITERVTITTCGSDFNTAMAVYTGSCASISSSSPIVSNDDNGPACTGNNASVNFSASAEVTYYVLVGGSSGAGGNLQIQALATPPPANDTCAGAVPMTPGTIYTVNTLQATEVGDPSPCCFGLGRGVWYSLMPSVTGPVIISTCGSDFNTAMAVYTGNCGTISQSSPITSNDDNGPDCSGKNASVNFVGSAGVQYWILVGGSSGEGGNLEIVASVAPPTNDVCSGAIAMTAGTTYTVPTFNATSSGDPSPACGAGFGRGVWFTYQPAASGPVGVSTCGSDFSTALAVYTGACGGTFTPVACSGGPGGLCANEASLVFNGTAGTNYCILAGGNNGTVGHLQIIIPIVDLVSTGLTATNPSGGPLVAGRLCTASWTVQNTGPDSITGLWTDLLTLSNATTQATVVSRGGQHTAPASGSYLESFSGTLPLVPPGTYSLIAQADSGNAVAEANKANSIEVISVTVIGLPPTVSLLTPTNQTVRVSCVAVPYPLLAQAQAGSYPITNVIFYDNGSNPLGQATNSPYSTRSIALEHGLHIITAKALDSYGFSAISTQATWVTIAYPTNLHVLREDIATDGDLVGCMCAYSGSNYVVESTTNVQLHTPWPPYVTNLAIGNVLAYTNHPTDPRRFFRARLVQ